MKTLTEIKAEVDRRAAMIGAAGPHSLPTYGHTEDLARPHIEVDSRVYDSVVIERGREHSRLTTYDLNDLLYEILETVTFRLAYDFEMAHRIMTQDCRRMAFQRQVELLSKYPGSRASIEHRSTNAFCVSTHSTTVPAFERTCAEN
jgi:hypothetical protein